MKVLRWPLLAASALSWTALSTLLGACASDDSAASLDGLDDAAVAVPVNDAGLGDANVDPDAGPCTDDCDWFPSTCAPDTLCPSGLFDPTNPAAGLDLRTRIHVIRGRAASDVWLAGALGAVAHFDGTSWKTSDLGTQETQRVLWLPSSGEIAFGNLSRLFTRRLDVGDGGADAGVSAGGWSLRGAAPVPAGSSSEVTAAWSMPGSDVLWLATPIDLWRLRLTPEARLEPVRGVPASVYVPSSHAAEIFRRQSDGDGGSAWVADYIADDAANPGDNFYILGASGSGQDDVWFGGSRGQFDAEGGFFACPLVVHKSAEGYRHAVDNVVNQAGHRNNRSFNICMPKAGSPSFSLSFEYPGYGTITRGWTNGGMVTNIASAGPNRAVGLMGRNPGDPFTYMSSDDAGVARVNTVNVSVPRGGLHTYLSSVWVHGTTAWFSGWGLVIKSDDGPEKWSRGFGLLKPEDNVPAAPTYETSTIALNGAAIDRPFHQVRGPSNTNLWAIGAGYALHKTTP